VSSSVNSAPTGGGTSSSADAAPTGGVGTQAVPPSPVNPSPTRDESQGATPGGGPAPTGTARPTAAPGPTNKNGGGGASQSCDLDPVAAIAAESSSDDQQHMQGWAPLRANGWIVFVPNNDWHLTASDAGFSAISPTGGIEADDVSWPSQTPWTEAALEQKFLADVADYHVICQTSYVQGPNGGSQGFEFTAVEEGTPIQGILILSLPTPQVTGFYSGQIRDLFTSQTQYSTATAETLMIIIKRAIYQP
jgi:hypothetical protein